jgi:hypothetical protein
MMNPVLFRAIALCGPVALSAELCWASLDELYDAIARARRLRAHLVEDSDPAEWQVQCLSGMLAAMTVEVVFRAERAEAARAFAGRG